MTMLTGPQLDKMRQELIDWWLSTRRRLIEALEEGYPYRSTQLTPDQQVAKFVDLGPSDWSALVERLMERYKGEPNRRELVIADLRRYQNQMYRLMGRR